MQEESSSPGYAPGDVPLFGFAKLNNIAFKPLLDTSLGNHACERSLVLFSDLPPFSIARALIDHFYRDLRVFFGYKSNLRK